MAFMYRLIFLNGKHKGRRLVVHQGSILIGRDPECHIHLADDDEVSRRHAVLEERTDGIYVNDPGSLNKILVNDQEIREALLKAGDILQLGKTRIQFQEAEPLPLQEERRIGMIQRMTFASVALVLLLEALFLIGLSVWHQEQFVEERPLPELSSTSGVAAVSAGVESNVLELADDQDADLMAAAERLKHLEEDALEPAPPAGPETTGALSSVSEELRKLRQDVAEIREKVQGMAVSSNEEALVEAPPEEDPVPVAQKEQDALEARARQMLQEAQLDIQRMNLIQADQQLERIQIMAPDFLPAYVERARLLERRGLLKKSGEQWTHVMNRSMGTPLYQQAAAERIRISRQEMVQTGLKTSARSDDENVLAKLPRLIRITDIEHQKFPGNEQFDEMRLLRIMVKVKPGEKGIVGNDVYVVVNFFDRSKESGQISLSGAVVPKEALTLEGPLEAGAQRTLTAAYIVPKGFRKTEAAQQGEERNYFGYAVRVLHRDSLQDEEAKPRILLKERIEPPSSSLPGLPVSPPPAS